jgi:periplasmic protein TonB
MEANKILQADLLDLLFEDRNKDYGAYELRRKYNKRITLALVITASIAAAIVGATFLSNALASSADDDVEVRDVVVQNIQEEAPPPPPPPPPPPKTPPPPPQLETAKFTPPVIKKDEEVRQEEIPPIEKLEEVAVAAKTQEGAKDEGLLNAPPVVDKGTQVVETKPVEDENKVFEKVEIEASVNVSQWRRHLESQLQRYIEDAASSGMSPGTHTVNVRFLVEKDGSITDVRALNDPGYGLGQGAVEVVKRGPKWSPGEQNGRKVRSYHTQPITFVIQEQ